MTFTPIRRRLLLSCLPALALLLAASRGEAASRYELDERVMRAGEVYKELRDAPDRRIPADLIARSRCVAVIPNVLKAAWVVGGRYGRGVLSCRSKSGDWSPPVHVLLTGGSFGFQVGASSTDVVLFFMTTNSVRSLLTNKVKLSGEAGVAAGPVGREAEAATDGVFRAEIYSYARSRGLFAGVSLAGAYIGVQRDDTTAYYGKSYSTTGILFEHKVTSVPKSAWAFLGSLPKPRGGSVAAKAERYDDAPEPDTKASAPPAPEQEDFASGMSDPTIDPRTGRPFPNSGVLTHTPPKLDPAGRPYSPPPSPSSPGTSLPAR